MFEEILQCLSQRGPVSRWEENSFPAIADYFRYSPYARTYYRQEVQHRLGSDYPVSFEVRRKDQKVGIEVYLRKLLTRYPAKDLRPISEFHRLFPQRCDIAGVQFLIPDNTKLPSIARKLSQSVQEQMDALGAE
jgi:hypothetical protein